ncbi:uncharacterized protein LOC104896591 [Beta vulgaris subsp. vulgaris]|uniref:uncharacterized protein LOC104896591 n=1 Tax=Beta vulgaris subsp. vulgaris TaxID=3555 RepID=UPI002036BA3D|nr:uncharacterized protein LOC104896591 [Beta vulgaris subsp. vulgaris]
MDIIQRAVGLVGEYAKAQEAHPREIKNDDGGCKVWKPPVEGSYKINADAAIFKDRTVGLGGVMRDAAGEVMGATCMHLEVELGVDEAEACAARHALQTAVEMGLRHIVLESDSLKVISHLLTKKGDESSFGNVVEDILWLGCFFSSISFNHVRREGNRVAHTIAQRSKEYGCMRVWMEEVPPEAVACVISDLALMNE